MNRSLNRNWVVLAVALAVGGLAAFGVQSYLQRQLSNIEARSKGQKTVRVLVPKEDLPKGTPLTPARIAVREIPAEWAHSNAIAPEQFERVEHEKLAYPAARGEMILWSLLEGEQASSFSSRLAAGRRAITVPVDEVNSISGMIEPGDRIDLMVAVRKDARTFMFPLLQNVTILATGTRAGVAPEPKEGRRTYTTITLEARPDEAQRVLAAREVGKLAAVLRAPGDAALQSPARRDAMTLLGLDDAGRPPDDASIPVLYGNRPLLKDPPRLTGAREGTFP